MPTDSEVAFAVVRLLHELAREQQAELVDLFPFATRFRSDCLRSEQTMILRIAELPGVGVPSCMDFSDQPGLRSIADSVLIGSVSPANVRALEDWYSGDVFSYVGPPIDGKSSQDLLSQALVEWINAKVMPNVLEKNRARVRRAIPAAPSYDPTRLLHAVCIIEDEEAAIQGTGFALEGVGVVTCHHVLGRASYALLPSNPGRHFPVRVLRANPDVDLAVLAIDGITLEPLRRSLVPEVPLNTYVAVIGFPNYRIGDSGVLMPGLTVGWRPRAGVRRILTNATIVAGMSGGPGVAADGSVVGVAATGAERPELAHLTEDHGLVPIQALDLDW